MPASSAARTRGRASCPSTRPPRWRCPACTPSSPPPTSTPTCVEAWYTGTGQTVPDTPRPPLAEGEARFAGDPVALVIADSRYIAEDAAELVDVDYEPLTAVADYAAPVLARPRARGVSRQPRGPARRSPLGTLAAVYDAAPHVVTETIWQQAYAAVPMETRGLVAEWSRGSGELTIWAATQAPHEVRMFAARLLGVPEHQVRVITRDVGGGFGQKVVPLREDICLLLAARKLPAAVKWVEDRRENLQSAGQARHEHGTARLAFDADGAIIAAALDHVQDVGAYPTPWPVGTGAATGMIFPGPYRVTKGTFTHASVFSSTSGAGRLPGTVVVRDAGPRGHPRHRRPPDRHRPGRAAPPQPAAPGRDAVPQPQRHAVRPHGPARDAGAGAGDPGLRRVPGRAGARARAGPLPRRRHLLLRRADDGRRSATTRPRARRSASSRPARSTSTSRADRPATAWRRRWSS